MSSATPQPDGLFGLSLPFGYGRLQQVPFKITAPAVAVGSSFVVAGAYRDRLICASATLVTDNNAGNRSVLLTLEDPDGGVLLVLGPAAVQAASTTVRYCWSVHVTSGVVVGAGAQLIQIPPLILQPGWQWVWSIDTVKAGDQLSAIAGLHDQFPTGELGYPVGMIAGARELAET